MSISTFFKFPRSPIRTRSFSRLRQLEKDSKMSNPDLSNLNSDPNVVKHEIYTTNVTIPRFSGVEGTIDLESYIERINNHILNKGIVDDNLKIECFKYHLDPEKGTARKIPPMAPFSTGNLSYAEYIKEFKQFFHKETDNDPLRAMSKFLKLRKQDEEDWLSYISRLDVFRADLAKYVTNSPWSNKTDPTIITVEQMAKLITMSKILQESEGSLLSSLYKNIKPTDLLKDIHHKIMEHTAEDPYGQYIALPVRTQSPSPNRNDPQGQNRQPRTRVKSKVRQNRGRSNSRPQTPGQTQIQSQTQIICFNCRKPGHTMYECKLKPAICGNCQYPGHLEEHCWNESFCKYHNAIGHKSRDCRGKPFTQRGGAHARRTQRGNFRRARVRGRGMIAAAQPTQPIIYQNSTGGQMIYPTPDQSPYQTTPIQGKPPKPVIQQTQG